MGGGREVEVGVVVGVFRLHGGGVGVMLGG